MSLQNNSQQNDQQKCNNTYKTVNSTESTKNDNNNEEAQWDNLREHT